MRGNNDVSICAEKRGHIKHNRKARLRLGVQDQADDQPGGGRAVSRGLVGITSLLQYVPVQSQNFAENQNQDHAHVYSRLLHVRPNALPRQLVLHDRGT